MVLTALSLLVTAVLTVLLLSTFLSGSGNDAQDNINNAPGIGLARNLQAQQALQGALSSETSAAAAGGGFASVTAATLQADNSSLTFVEGGPTTNWTTVSVATSTVTPAGAPSDSDGFSGVDPDSGADATPGGQSGGSGSITLAAMASGTCWLIWSSGSGQTLYGAQTGLTSCTAPVFNSAPQPGPVSSGAIGWQRESFPSAL